MKIFVNSRLIVEKQTGIQSYIINLYSAILKLDKLNDYVFIQPQGDFVIGNTNIVRALKGFLGNMLFDCFLINQVLKKENKNVIIFHGTSFILPFFKLKNIKYVLTIHDLSFKLFPKNHSKLFNMYYDFFLRKSLNYADRIIVNSKNTKDDIVNIYDISPDKISITYLAGNKSFDVSGCNIKKKCFSNYFLAIGGHSRKNLISVIKALEGSNVLKNYKLLIVGNISNNYKTYLTNLANEIKVDKNVDFIGYVNTKDLISLYHYAEFFIYPSFYEGFGIPVIEAMMAKCPVVTSNTSCFREVVPFNYGYLVDPYSIEDMRNKMEQIVSLSKEARDRLILENYNFSKKFSWEKCANETISIFNSLIK